MSFIASSDQIAAFKQRCANPSYSQDAIGVEFTTTTEFISSVLPPTLEPADKPTGLISVSLCQSNVCGSFELSSISVRCRCDGVEGYWVLHLIVSESAAITWGRETWGEVKRDGKARLHSCGTLKSAFAERLGVRLIEIEADFTTPLEPEQVEWFDFEVKAFPNAQGTGLDADPNLIALKVVDSNNVRASGKGRLTIRGTQSDPLHTIPIKAVGDFFYNSGPSDWMFVSQRRLCSADEYMPYYVFRHYGNLVDLLVGVGLNPIQMAGELEEGLQFTRARTWVSANTEESDRTL
ncbi:uncharacterized protein CTRU02_212269 [Colletotrichum truncatum]|uniref:Uncharacterized protein n=1 Tax=Colletotrichum truncatum TaxID=5467 RepID=A0ACC3YNL6_COLTU|nr:uncharacterized protein CTRU02_08854 [Colletotrichum truncatum]KAF6789607.1 hypothetical protein CTRU02_08854 [Colletotrichum truncatum]